MYSEIFAAIIVIVICLILFIKSRYNVDRLYSRIDGEYYNVHKLHPLKQAAADILAKINANIVKLFRYIKHQIEEGKVHDQSKIEAFDRLLVNYDPTNIVENSSFGQGTSYTENKGAILAICLRYKKDHKFHDINTLTFVTVHELAHLMSMTYGHNREFWQNFKFLLGYAVKINIYKPINYRSNPIKYCGMVISYCPLYDESLD